MPRSYSPFHLMMIMFGALFVSFLYAVVGSAYLRRLGGETEAQQFFAAYTTSFKTIISLGLILGTASIIFITQHAIPKIIEEAFTKKELSPTKYFRYKRRLYSLRRSISFSAFFTVAAFFIFSQAHFPLSARGEVLMLIAACAQYALGVFVGRKLIYLGMMLHSLLDAKITRNLFRHRLLDDINSYVNLASTLTIVFVYIHVISYYEGPFLYDNWTGRSIRLFLILPAIIATPVLLIFNFYPRLVLRKLYNQSIDLEINRLKDTLNNEELSDYEKRSHVIEFDRMSREELRYNLQLTLSDLPIGITILIMVLEPLLRR